ncbi:2,3-diaminopropionate biosynthesis protein SbnA [[Actinomadura] parvosata subsp. kistnae]|uniref:N-(2-amino-2-carboxyethyl)-L-glutamate synthase n=1 Tax=[Actinomadura] parvosata subsp. kistnae TaxID=1909395 RepID=A0A1V0AC55_9ACTN|nr:2,3-diaminopropionate biosynthesis protein SbnA [Nonomuraea sp. ATCC 55076]
MPYPLDGASAVPTSVPYPITRDGILATVGQTPLVRLDRLFPGFHSRVFAKLERFNPGGSIKDRSALSMLSEAIRAGELEPGRSTVIESSSGNLAVGMAQICRYFGVRFICVVDAKTTEQNLAILKAFQAEVEVVDSPDPETGEYLPRRIQRVRELMETVPHAYHPDQYGNPLNSRAHHATMREIVEALDGQIDHLLCSVGSCGTLVGCADYVRAHGLPITINAVDAVGSMIFDGQTRGPRLLPGHGAAVRPALFRPDAADRVVHVNDLDCVVGCRKLSEREAILAGGSSGATVAALAALRAEIPPGSTCVLVFPDGGDRYLNTIYSDAWVRRTFGEVSHLWKDED